LLAGCRNFNFYREKEPICHLGFDDADKLLDPNSTPDTVALPSVWNTIGFVKVLYNEISCRPCVSHDYYLLYDDEGT